MRRHAVRAACAVLALAACSSSGGKVSTGASTSTSAGPATPGSVTTNPNVTAQPADTQVASTTTAPGCPGAATSTAPVAAGAAKPALLLLTVSVNSTSCSDRVVFSFSTKSHGAPSCGVAYRAGPFTQDGSGKPVAVAGAAFVVVRCSPAYGYDYQNGKPSYTGPKHVAAAAANHVQEVAETGDFEGVVTWVVGLDSQRPFAVTANTIPPGLATLVVTFS
jgi:hypothetical protein